MPEPIQVPVRYQARAYYTSDLDEYEVIQTEEGNAVEGTNFDDVLEEARYWFDLESLPPGEHGVLAIVTINESIQVIV